MGAGELTGGDSRTIRQHLRYLADLGEMDETMARRYLFKLFPDQDETVLLDKRLDTMSQSELSALSIASILASRNQLLVLDEPFAKLNAAQKETLASILNNIQERKALILSLGDQNQLSALDV